MKIAILLPYKENFTKNNAGAVSIFVNDTNQLSKYKNEIKVYGSTEKKNKLKNYTNIILKKNILLSTSNQYLKNFSKIISHEKIDMNFNPINLYGTIKSITTNIIKNHCNLYKQRFTFIKLYLVVGSKQKFPRILKLIKNSLKSSYDVIYTKFKSYNHSFGRSLLSKIYNFTANIALSKPKEIYLSSFKSITI